MITLDKIVREYLIESGSMSEHKYARMLQIAISGLRELNMDVSGIPKTVYLDLDFSTYSVNLPEDFISHVFIGFCENGRMVSFGKNDAICTGNTYDDCGNLLISYQNTGNAVLEIDGIYRNGEFIGGIFGLGGGNNANGYYKIDINSGRIFFSNINQSEILLEYLGSPQKINGEHVIHEYEAEAIKAWMYWKEIYRDKNIAVSQKEAAKQEYIRNKGLAQRRRSSFTIEEALQSIRRGNKQSPKM